MKTKILWAGILALPLAVAGSGGGHAGDGVAHAQSKPAAKPHGQHATAVAVLNPTAGNSVRGVVRFHEGGGKVSITAVVEGLNPNQEHAIHIHEYGDCSAPDGTSAAGHYNPEGHAHALPASAERHAGDLGNLKADANGRAQLQLTVDNISIHGPKNPILGRGMIVHAKVDDGGQPTGNAGARIACGVIGMAKHAH